MKMLIKENSINWNHVLSEHSPKVEYVDISNKFKELANREKLNQEFFDVFVFDSSNNYKSELDLLNRLKVHNPDIKSVVLTSEHNRKYRSQLVSMGVDHFLFRESDMNLLEFVLKQLNLRLTKTSINE